MFGRIGNANAIDARARMPISYEELGAVELGTRPTNKHATAGSSLNDPCTTPRLLMKGAS